MTRLCLALFLYPLAFAQEPPRTVIRTETQLVLVEATVQDKKGNPVSDLAAKDFHVWEDGKEQTIASLSTEKSTAAPDKSARHYLVLFFDNVTQQMSAQLAARHDAAKFVGAWAAPDRYMSVIDFGASVRITQGFTTLPGLLTQALSGVQASGQSGVGVIQLEGRTISGTQPSAQVAGGTGTGMDASNSAAPARPGGGRGRGGPPAVSADEQALNQSPGLPSAQQDLLSGIQTAAESLASIRGRKALVLFTAGFPTAPSASQMAAVISACNDANVAVYVANPSAYKALADGTGGRVIVNANDLVGQLGQIAEAQEEHYVLSYTPPDSPAGSCHNLRVSVDRPGLDVEARKGYCSARPVGLSAAAKVPEGPAVARVAEPSLAASLQLPYFYSSPNVARVNLAMEIASAAIKFDKSKGKPHAELHFTGVASKADGSVAGRFDDTVRIDLDSAKESEAFAKQPYHYEYQFDLAPGQYRLHVTVASGGATLGAVDSPLSIDPWDGRKLAISGLAFSKENRPVTDLASTLDDASLEDRRALIAGGHQMIPYGGNRFHAGAFAMAMAYVEVYDPSLTGATPPTVTLRIRVLDRQTGQLKLGLGTSSLANFIRPGNALVPVAFNLPDSLTPGAYRLEITAAHSSGAETAVRTVDFDIEQ